MGNVDNINILTYNIFCRPSYICYDEQLKRAKLIPSVLRKYIGGKKFEKIDAICFLEAFDHDVNDILTEELYNVGFKYSTNILNSYAILKLKFINGGIRFFSKYPIERSEFRMFPFSGVMNLESYIGKGALVIKIKKGERFWHIIGTHLAAWSSGEKDRKYQMELIDDFINDMKYVGIVKSGEPVIVTGDFNIDVFTDLFTVKKLYKCLNTYRVPSSALYKLERGIGSYCKAENNLVGRDGEDREEINELLDYSLLVKDKKYTMARYSTKILFPYKSMYNIRGIMYKDTGIRSRNLSDHFPNLTQITVKFR